MLRRQTRLRREYLYKKSLEEKEKVIGDRKARLKEALQNGQNIPFDLKEDHKLLSELQFDDSYTEASLSTQKDNEYNNAGIRDPKIMITTSRDPSSRLNQFAKEMKLVFPNSQRVNRGNYVLKDLVSACKSNEISDLVILHEHRGVPDGMIVSHFPHGPTAYFSLHNVVLRHDIPNQGSMSEANPHLIFNNFNSRLGNRVQSILKYLFPVPKEESSRVLTFANSNDFISFRHHVFHKKSKTDIELAEVGPRFEMRPYEIRLGTVDITDADVEWVLRPYMNTSNKKDVL